VRAALLALVLLGADGTLGFRFSRAKLPDFEMVHPTHEGRLPDGTKVVVYMRAGEKLVPQPPHTELAFIIEQPDGGSRYHTVPAGTELHQLDGGAVRLERATGHEHCWHASPLQHTVANHRDEYCCHCAVDRCVNLSWPGLCGEGHGPRCTEPQLDLKRPRMP
jgi:hypothetical protein